MDRIATATKAVDLHGAGKHGFTGGNPNGSTPPTKLSADWCNAVQEEICNLIEGADVTLDDADNGQLLESVGRMVRGFLPEYVGEFGYPMLYRTRQYGNERDTWYAYRQVEHVLNTASGGTAEAVMSTPTNTYFKGRANVVIVCTDNSGAQAGYELHFHGRNVAGTADISHEDIVYGDDGGLAISGVFTDFAGANIKLGVLFNALPAAKKYNVNVEFELTVVTRYAP